MSQRRPLEVIQVSNPCARSWDEMSGDDTRRFCSHCNKYVHNLSAMSLDDAEHLVCENAGKLCARFERDPQSGQVITLDYAPKRQVSRLRAALVIAALMSAGSIAASWAAYELFLKPEPAAPMIVTVGELVAPLPPPNMSP
jgi:hypothetical protein